MTSRSVVIAEPVRTAIGAFGGTLKDMPAPDLGAVAIRAAVERAGLKPEEVETVAMGNVIQAGTKMNPARQAAVQAGLPVTVPAMTVNRVCGSGAQAIAGTTFFGAAMARLATSTRPRRPAPRATAMPRLLCPTPRALRKPARSKFAPSGSPAPCARGRALLRRTRRSPSRAA